MEKKLSAFQKGRIVCGVINDLKALPNKSKIYINTGLSWGDNMKKIANKSSIITGEYMGDGMVNISEDIEITIDHKIYKAERKLNGIKPSHNQRDIIFDVSEELKLAVDEFETKHIPSHGTCKTTLGEIFRAIQYIQYRAFNDGDLCWEPGSPSFMSYIYLKSQIDELNHSSSEELEFTDPFIRERSYGEISDVIEDDLAQIANFIKYQIMDLLLNEKIKDTPNEFNSRNFSSLKEDRY